jgi:tripartite ATP-independent transporter DctP family solute receptor
VGLSEPPWLHISAKLPQRNGGLYVASHLGQYPPAAALADGERPSRVTLKRILTPVVLLFALAAAISCRSGSGPTQRELKWAHVYETSEPYHTWAVWAGQEIEKRTTGKFHIRVFPASSLGKETDINQGLQLGTVDLITSGVAFAARSFPRLGIAYYPYLFRDVKHLLAYSQSDVFRELTEGFRAKTGVQILSYMYYGARHTTAQKPFSDCAGMQGLKLRVPDASVYAVLPRACAANPTPLAFAEVYLALQNGTVDAQENPLTTIDAKKFYEVQKHIMLTAHVYDGLTTQVAPHIWNTLSDAEKGIFSEVAREAAARVTADIEKREAELVEVFKGRGLGVHELDRKSFQDAVQRSTPVESLGFERADFDRIVALH